MSVGDVSGREGITGKMCVRGAWLGLGAAAIPGGKPPLSASEPPVSAGLSHAAALMQSLVSTPPVDSHRLLLVTRETLGRFVHPPLLDDGLPAGLLPALVLTLWIRSKDPWRVLTAASGALGCFELTRFQQLGTLSLCLWVRQQIEAPTPEESWRIAAESASRSLAESDMDPESITFPLRACDPPQGCPEDVHKRLVTAMLRCASADDFPSALAFARESFPDAADAAAAAGFMYGFFKGADALPQETVDAALAMPWVRHGVDELARKHGLRPILRARPVITSRSLPLPVAPVTIGRTQMMLSVTPGYSATIVRYGGGPIIFSRDLDEDLAVLVAAGARALVCLLEADEIVDGGLDALASSAALAGLDFHWLPMRSGSESPVDPHELMELAGALKKLCDAGQAIAVHADGWEPRLGAGATLIACSLEPDVPPVVVEAAVDEAISSQEGQVDYDALV